MIVYKVTGATICIAEQEKIVAGDVNTHTARFDLSEDWEGLGVTAVFYSGDKSMECVLSEGQCVIPWELLTEPGYLYAACYGVHTDGEDMERKLSTISPGIAIRKGTDDENLNPPPPTPDIYEQMLSALAKKQDKLTGKPGDVVTFDDNGNAISKDLGFDKPVDRAEKAADDAEESAKEAYKSEQSAKNWAELAEQGAQNAGWFTMYGEDGILYMVRSDNAPEDFQLKDDGKGVLTAVYG